MFLKNFISKLLENAGTRDLNTDRSSEFLFQIKFWIFRKIQSFTVLVFYVNLFIFLLFPENSVSSLFSLFYVNMFTEFSIFGEFVYFWTFPGKIQSFQFWRICLFLDFSRKIQSFQFLVNLLTFWILAEKIGVFSFWWISLFLDFYRKN